jgi:hypothetical protein
MSDGFDQIPKFIRESWFVIMKVGVFCFGFWGWEQLVSLRSFISA